MNDATKQWLLKIATAVESYPTMLKDDVRALFVKTPADFVVYIVNSHIPDESKTGVIAALKAIPPTNVHDWAEAARHIRQAVERLR